MGTRHSRMRSLLDMLIGRGTPVGGRPKLNQEARTSYLEQIRGEVSAMDGVASIQHLSFLPSGLGSSLSLMVCTDSADRTHQLELLDSLARTVLVDILDDAAVSRTHVSMLVMGTSDTHQQTNLGDLGAELGLGSGVSGRNLRQYYLSSSS